MGHGFSCIKCVRPAGQSEKVSNAPHLAPLLMCLRRIACFLFCHLSVAASVPRAGEVNADDVLNFNSPACRAISRSAKHGKYLPRQALPHVGARSAHLFPQDLEIPRLRGLTTHSRPLRRQLPLHRCVLASISFRTSWLVHEILHIS